MLETRYLLALGVLVFWIIVRIFLMQRRKALVKRWQERAELEAEADQAAEINELPPKLDPPK